MDTYQILTIVFIVISVLELAYILFQYKKSTEEVSEEELKDLVNEGQENGVLLTQEAAMIQNIFQFDEKDAKDIMVHRKDIVAVDENSTLSELIAVINSNHLSRIPVYSEDMEHITGVIHIKDVLLASSRPELLDLPVKDLDGLIGEVDFVPQTHSINTLFAKMQNKKIHLVMVVDEYGQICGLISMEDILEEIVGNIFDEHDEEEEQVAKVAENVFVMDGLTPLSEVAEMTGITVPEDFETLNGFIIGKLGRIPEEGSCFTIEDQGYSFFVRDVQKRVCQSVVVKLLPANTGKNDSVNQEKNPE